LFIKREKPDLAFQFVNCKDRSIDKSLFELLQKVLAKNNLFVKEGNKLRSGEEK
jgi:hypothetical protein